jgi:hypothetical protein
MYRIFLKKTKKYIENKKFFKTTLCIKQLIYKSNLQRRSNYKKVLGPEQHGNHQETVDEEAASGELGYRLWREQQGGMTESCVS